VEIGYIRARCLASGRHFGTLQCTRTALSDIDYFRTVRVRYESAHTSLNTVRMCTVFSEK